MKNLLLLVMIFSIGYVGHSQHRVLPTKEQRNLALKTTSGPTLSKNLVNPPAFPSTKSVLTPEEETIGNSRYDLQSNASCQNRFHIFDDGTMGATWTYGILDPNFADRGTGYNYFDGESWGPAPTEVIEDQRSGWPSYDAFGVNGEIICAHYSGTASGVGGLAISKRTNKGTGDWSLVELHSPEPAAELLWPRLATGGVDNSVLHVIAMTMPVANNGVIYQGLDGALLYSRSTDGGETWDPQNLLMDELSSEYYNSFSSDSYEVIAEEDNVAILYGEAWQDLALLKSTDGGNTFDQTIIWEHPYPLWVTGTPTDTFYCADGAHHLAFDSEGMVHVVFGINRAYADAAGSYWFPLVDGVGYWNENRPTFSNSMDALNPYGEAGSELEDNVSLIGWMQDLNGNNTIDVLEDVGAYYVGASSMPQLIVTDEDDLFVVYSSVTEGYNNNFQNYRHLWARHLPNGASWGNFVDLNASLLHTYDECIYPSIASYSDDYLYLIYQTDDLPGLAVRGDLDPYSNNSIWFLKQALNELLTGTSENNLSIYEYDVLQNYPNPATGTTTIKVNIRKATDLSIEVLNMVGQKVMSVDAGNVQQGMNAVDLDISKLTSGVYFYTVKAGDAEITKKMIVE